MPTTIHPSSNPPAPTPSPSDLSAKAAPPPPLNPTPQTILLAFDFDHTLVDLNSDLLPFQSPSTLPCGVPLFPNFATLGKQLGRGSWTRIMQLQLTALARQEGYSRESLLACLKDVRMDEGLVTALKRLAVCQKGPGGQGQQRQQQRQEVAVEERSGDVHEQHSGKVERVEMVVASDANEVFIQEILDANGLVDGVFGGGGVGRVYTNRARWAEPGDSDQGRERESESETKNHDAEHNSGAGSDSMIGQLKQHDGKGSRTSEDVLVVEPYQPPDTPHGCPRCAANMCKTSILAQAKRDLGLEQTESALRTVYVGDGGNDYCPALSLRPDDLLLVREGYALDKLLNLLVSRAAAADNNDDDDDHDKSAETKRTATTDGSEAPRDKSPNPKVVANIRRWNTQEELGRLLLELIGEKHMEAARSIISDPLLPPELATVEQDFAKKATL